MPHHTHTHAHAGHELQVTIRNPLTARFLEHMHDTELWASHIPRVPMGLYLLAILGLAFGAASITSILPDSAILKFSTLMLGCLLILPA